MFVSSLFMYFFNKQLEKVVWFDVENNAFSNSNQVSMVVATKFTIVQFLFKTKCNLYFDLGPNSGLKHVHELKKTLV